jgi:hypothetical protein
MFRRLMSLLGGALMLVMDNVGIPRSFQPDFQAVCSKKDDMVIPTPLLGVSISPRWKGIGGAQSWT